MGISFKVSKIGKRYRPKPGPLSEDDVAPGSNGQKEKDEMATVNQTSVSNQSNGFAAPIPPDLEVSFCLSLFQPGYHVGKPNEMPQDRKTLHPYDRASENLFSAIEAGWLPGDILDDIPSKYYNGTVICEVKDYRKCRQEHGSMPVIHKVRLKMSLENVVKDVHFMSDDSWTYGDLLEVESRIVKAMQPKLCLDPNPMLDRLCTDPIPTKLNLGLGRKRRSEITVTTSNKFTGKKVCIEKSVPVPDQETSPVPVLPGGAHPFRQISNLSQEAARIGLPPLSAQQYTVNNNNNNITNINNNNINNNNINNNINNNNNYPDAMLSVKKEFIDPSQLPTMEMKKARQIQIQQQQQQQQQQQSGPDELAHQVRGAPPQMGLNHQLQQYAAALAGQRFPTNADLAGPSSFYQSVRFNSAPPKEEQQQQQLDVLTQQWQNSNNPTNSGLKRKTASSPRVPQSPVSSLSSGQKDVKLGQAANHSAPAGGKRRSGSKTLQQQQQSVSGVGSPVSVSNMTGQQQLFNVSSPSVATSLAGGAGASDQNSVLERFAKLEVVAINHKLHITKPKAEAPPPQKKANTAQAAQVVAGQLAAAFASEDFTETEGPMSLSLVGGSINTYKSRILHFVKGERSNNYPGMVRNQYQLVLMEKPFDGTVGMQHGDVESDSDNPFTSPDCPLSLRNIHYADLLAAQFVTLMEKYGYEKKEDQIRPLPIRMVAPPSQGPLPFSPDPSQQIESKPDISMLPAGNNNNPQQQQQQQPVSLPASPVPSNRMLPAGSNNPSMPQQGYAQAQTSQSQTLMQQQQMHQQNIQQQQQTIQNIQNAQQNVQQNMPQRSGPMMSANPLAQMMSNKSMPLQQQQQLQMLQQQQQQQQQQIPRKVMMGGLGAGPTMSNMVGLGGPGLGGPGLGNIMGINSMRNLSPSAVSALSGLSPNQMGLTGLAGQFRPGGLGGLSPAQQAALKMRYQRAMFNAQSAGGNMSNMGGNINSINNINSAMLANSTGINNMMSHAMSRAGMGQVQMQRAGSGLGPMGPPKMQAGQFYMNNNNNNNNNNSSQQQQQMQLQQMQQQMQQQMGSPLQQVGSPQQTGSGQSGLSIQQQQMQQQQQQQMSVAMSPQQMSGSNLPQVSNSGGGNINNNSNNMNNNGGNNGNNVMPPASPQLSSQTQGSVGSSPMEQLQGANKGGGNI